MITSDLARSRRRHLFDAQPKLHHDADLPAFVEPLQQQLMERNNGSIIVYRVSPNTEFDRVALNLKS